MIIEDDIFLNTDDFAEEVELIKNNSSRQIVCNFNEEGTTVNIGENQVITTNPFCDIKKSEAADINQGDIIKRNNINYYINYVIDSGDGFARLILSREQT